MLLLMMIRCWFRGGHEWIVKTTIGHIYLECMECRTTTHGWKIGKMWE